MSLDNLKNKSRRGIEMWGSNRSERPEDIFAENYINHQEPDVEGGISEKTLEAWKELVNGYHEAFSDSKVRILMQLAEDEVVATRWEFEATHSGDFLGHSSTGRRVTWTGKEVHAMATGPSVRFLALVDNSPLSSPPLTRPHARPRLAVIRVSQKLERKGILPKGKG